MRSTTRPVVVMDLDGERVEEAVQRFDRYVREVDLRLRQILQEMEGRRRAVGPGLLEIAKFCSAKGDQLGEVRDTSLDVANSAPSGSSRSSRME